MSINLNYREMHIDNQKNHTGCSELYEKPN